MKRLYTKPCPYCGTPIEGKKRRDRNSYHYAPRCLKCTRKALDPETKQRKREVLNKVRVVLPVGSTRLHKASDGFFYILEKTAQPNKWEYQHRIVTNAPKGHHVHHINEITTDNRIENLVVISPQEHMRGHLSISTWSKQYSCCIKCHTTSKRHLAKGLCTTCYQRK